MASSGNALLGQVVQEVVESVGLALPLHLDLAVDLLVVLSGETGETGIS